MNGKDILLETDDKFICSENGLFINIGLSKYKYEFIIVYHGESTNRKMSCIDIYNPKYLYNTNGFLSKYDKINFINIINKYWNSIINLYKDEYNNPNNPDYDLYLEYKKDKIIIPSNPPDYSLLETVD